MCLSDEAFGSGIRHGSSHHRRNGARRPARPSPAGTPGFALMLSAGQAVAEAAMDLAEEGPILVVAGRGNNGGDGFVAAAELAARGREVSVILLCERDSLQGDAALGGAGLEISGAAVQPAGDRQAGADHRCAVRRRPQPAGEGRSARHDRGDQRQRRAGAQRRSAERHQRHHRRGDGRRRPRHRDRHLLPPQAGASAAAGTDALRPRARRRHRHRRRCAGRDQAADIRERTPDLWRSVVSGAADRRPQICARPCGRRLRRYRRDRRGAACRRAARCGRARGSSRWPRRATRSRSTRRR